MPWFLQSRKAQVALGSIVTILLARLLPRLGFSPEDINVLSGSIVVVASFLIGGIAHEDAAAKSGPAQQTNIDSTVSNTPAPAAPVTQSTPVDTTPLTRADAPDLIAQGIAAYQRQLIKQRAAAAAARPPQPPQGKAP